jgi:hypothetical protein
MHLLLCVFVLYFDLLDVRVRTTDQEGLLGSSRLVYRGKGVVLLHNLGAAISNPVMFYRALASKDAVSGELLCTTIRS